MKGYSYSDAWKAVIRPPRDDYKPDDLGPDYFPVGTRLFYRKDFSLTNPRGLKLQCSHFEPIDTDRVKKELPCVIFLHGNSSSRVEGIRFADMFLRSNITFFCFDFSGSGHSDGEYISLGWWEREDVGCVVEYLRSTKTVSTIGLWGRSMGAATALLYADRDPGIAGIVLDSPFSSMKRLVEELYHKYAPKVPGFLFSILQYFVKKSIKSRAHFDLGDLCPINHVDKTYIPSLFIVAKSDDFILPSHGIELYEKYAGQKNLIKVDGDHNSFRPPYAIISIYTFFFNALQVATLLPPGENKMELPQLSKMEQPSHIAPQPIGPMIIEQPPVLDPSAADDEEMKQAIEASIKSFKEEQEKKKLLPEK